MSYRENTMQHTPQHTHDGTNQEATINHALKELGATNWRGSE